MAPSEAVTMSSYLFKNARIVDGSAAEPTEPTQVLVEGGQVREVNGNITANAEGTIVSISPAGY